MATYSVGGRTGPTTRTLTGGGYKSDGSILGNTPGKKNELINKMTAGGGINALGESDRRLAASILSPDEYSQFALGKAPAGSAGGAGGTGGAGTGGLISATDLLSAYQKGVGGAAGQSAGDSVEDRLRLMRETNALDLAGKTAEQKLQLEGQAQVLDQTQDARARERATEFELENTRTRQQAGAATAAFRSL